MSPWLENTLLRLVDDFYRYTPRKAPSPETLQAVKLVSHRGERDNKMVFENTFAAFDPVVENGIWGIELDIRWTKDLVPVVIHDADGLRVFGKDFVIADNDWQSCQKALPLVPSLEQLIERYGKKCHLMVELKQEDYPEPLKQKQILENTLRTLEPVTDFHIISLDCEMFGYVDFLPPKALLPVSTVNAKALSQFALEQGLGGITGHYLFMTKTMLERHKAAGQLMGSGFSNSKNVLFREINKGCEWIFSNKALSMNQIIKNQLK